MMRMRAKMVVINVEKHETCQHLSFSAVGRSDGYPEDGSDENNNFAKWTPTARISMTVTNPALFDKFDTGQQFYVDFTAV